ncbi:hypothetical protein CK203_031580 [Vitis vinifera]|uniref:Reverse transcriptase zinc-binding domain-containing protein n=1 Tax=Vitis vinifera TaxID=29760 RepID=A0A438IG37_VITVI|nr:hypothetical protein CK203_031580 [Vitis vinifera]
MMEPLIKGPAGLEYLKKAFANRYGPPTDAHTSLPLTMQWLSSVHSSAEQEWDEYKDSVSSLTVNNERLYQGLPPTTLRTGGSIPMASRLGSPSSKGERVDLLVRVGLLKLVNEIGGLMLETLPETLKLNLSRLRGVQSQFQKIIVIATRSLYSMMEPWGLSLFPSERIWRARVPPKVAFFAWEASWGKVLTQEQLQRRGFSLANRCFLCLSEEETMDHLLLHCIKTRILWNLLFSLFGISWTLSGTVKTTLLGWNGGFVGKRRKKAWQMAPLCIFWSVWKERNRGSLAESHSSLLRLRIWFSNSLIANVYLKQSLSLSLSLSLSFFFYVLMRPIFHVYVFYSVLVLRQTLLSENMVTTAADMENIVSSCIKQLSKLLDTVEDVGISEIVGTISSFPEGNNHTLNPEKLQARKEVMANMLGKSLQAGDAIFTRVSHTVYLAARGIVLGGNGLKGRQLAEAALRRIGASLLTENVVEAAEVLIVVTTVSSSVHGAWYEELVKNL